MLIECINNHAQNIGRNMNAKGGCDKVSEGKKEHVVGQWRKSYPSYKVAKIYAFILVF
jgi:hypothetical protein